MNKIVDYYLSKEKIWMNSILRDICLKATLEFEKVDGVI